MTAALFPDITVLINFILSIAIVALSFWGFVRIGKLTPLYFGLAYSLFATSHLMILLGMTESSGILLVVLRTAGYIFVAVGLFALIQDILERKSTEKALRESEEKLSATFEQAAVGMAEVQTGYTISRCNKRFCGILGYRANDLLTTNIWDLISPEGQLRNLDEINAVVRGDRPDYSAEMRLSKKNGSLVWVQVFLSPVSDQNGRPKYFILVIEDIAARKKAEEELEILNAGLEERVLERTSELATTNDSLIAEIVQRTEAEEKLKLSLQEKEVLIKEIHHRVKNNLQIIISLLFLQAKKTSDPGSADALIDSQTRVKSMALVHEKLYQSGDLAAIDFEGYIRNLVKNLMVSYGIENGRVTTRFDAKDLPVTINVAIPLGLIMNELVSNSLKYAFLPGQLGEISISGREKDGRLEIAIKDNGRGIPVELDWRHAESLGLNLVQMLIRQLRGTIELTRIDGTEFILSIPMGESRDIS